MLQFMCKMLTANHDAFDFDCLQMRSLLFDQWFGCSFAFRCFFILRDDVFFFFTWQSPVVLNLCIAPCFDINVLRLFVWYICTYFVWMSNLFVQESVVCEDWYIFVVLNCVCLDTRALDLNVEMWPCESRTPATCTFRDVFSVGWFCVL